MPRGQAGEKQWKKVNFSMFPGDLEIIEYIKEQLGISSNSEVVRTALRAYAMPIEALMRARE